VNNDWENWVLLHGKSKAVEADFQDIGKTVGVSFTCNTSNSFNLLTREGRKGWRAVGGGGCLLLSMKLLSYNVMGLGGGEKREEVRKLVYEKHPFVLCIQESKLGVVDDLMIKSIWGNTACGYSYQPSVGASGGLVTVWDTSCVDVWSTMSYNHVLVIKGMVVRSAEDFIIINVYMPCDSVAKQALWDVLLPIIVNNNDVCVCVCVCVCGDFNFVRTSEEKRGRSTVFRQADADLFNKFIEDNFLIDLLFVVGCLLGTAVMASL